MKKNVLFLFLTSLSIYASSQNNVLQLNASSFVFRKLPELSYEHYFKTQNVAFSLGFGYKLPRNKGSYSSTELTVNGDTNFLNQRNWEGFRITPELKFYTSKDIEDKAKGFYFSMFGRYSAYNVQANFNRKVDAFSKQLLLDGEISNLSFGVSIGTRFIVGSRCTIDVTWLGVGYGTGRADFTLKSTDSNVNWSSLDADIKDAEMEFLKSASTKVFPNGIEASTRNPFSLILRSSFSIGLYL